MPLRRALPLLAALASPGIASAADTLSECRAPAVLDDGWAVAAPAGEGFEPALLCALGPALTAWTEGNAHAVLVARHGRLVYERYFAGEDQIWGRPLGRIPHDAGTKHDLRSITKSVTALLVGIAVDTGWIKDIDAPALSLLPQYADLRSPETDRITLRHLLTMSSGLAWNEELPYSDPRNSERLMSDAPDPYRYVLEQPFAAAPGERFTYSGGATALLSAVLKQVSGRPLDVLAREVLFAPLGIADAEWVRYPNGDPIAASGLRLRPRDIARIGQLVLDRGAWQGKQIVSAAWIEQATAPQITVEDQVDYGFQWWLGRSLVDGREVRWAAGLGWGGQRLFLVPSAEVLVVITAGLYDRPDLQDQLARMVLERHVLPAVMGPDGSGPKH
ncbi:serine hydrolase domain-containing protein [Inquilinus limosus]|uniref:serine hydrolase domain-containing protein n=1 Tax=Inquilinus limosus TaxID=171674 RepID=UPI00138AE2A3|nr:serine hydrolase [Inquilinus limosus]